jgi:FAD/FMN-containing dehydrogenase
MIDLNSTSPWAITARINPLVDAACQQRRAEEPPRDYLGCSILGHPCERAIQYEISPPVEKTFPARVLRIFDRGHWAEDYAMHLLQKAGLVFAPHESGQYEVAFLGGRVKGHADGVIVWERTGSHVVPIPCLWECKCLGAKYWRELTKTRLKSCRPTYYGQVHLYMQGLDLNVCLFTAVNADTMEMHHELVERDEATANRLLSRAGHILLATDHGELLPRLHPNRSHVDCKICSWSEACWA